MSVLKIRQVNPPGQKLPEMWEVFTDKGSDYGSYPHYWAALDKARDVLSLFSTDKDPIRLELVK